MSFQIEDGALTKYTGRSKKVVIPDGVTTIKSMAFNTRSLEEVTIPANVRAIEEDAFYYDCENLLKIVIEGYSTVIESGAFNYDPMAVIDFVLPKDYFLQTTKIDTQTVLYLLGEHMCFERDGVGLDISITPQDFAALLLFQTDKKLLNAVAKEAAKVANKVVTSMIELLQKNGEAKHYANAAQFVLGSLKKVSGKNIKNLYLAAENANANEAMKMLAQFVPGAKETVKDNADTGNKSSKVKNPIEDHCREKFDIKAFENYLKSRKIVIPAQFNKIKYKDSSDIVPDFVVLCAVVPYIMQFKTVKEISKYNTDFLDYKLRKEADTVAEALDKESLREAFDGFITDEVPKELCWLIPLGRFASGEQINALYSKLKLWGDWEENGATGRKAIFVARSAIILNESREAKQIVMKMKPTSDFKFTHRGPVQIAAHTLGISESEYCYVESTDFALDADGVKQYDIGGNTIEARWTDNLTWELYDTANQKIIKTFPKKGDDPGKAASCAAEFSEMKKETEKEIKNRVEILHQIHMNGDALPFELWKKTYFDNPLIRQLSKTLVWCDNTDDSNQYFTLKNRDFSDVNSQPYKPAGKISLAHVIEMPQNELNAWRKYFAGNHISQLFNQLWEPVVNIDQKGTQLKERYQDTSITDKQRNELKAVLKKRGIKVSSEGNTTYDYRSRTYRSDNNCLRFENAMEVSYVFDEDEKILTFSKARFIPGTDRARNASIYELDKAVLSSRIIQDDAQLLTEEVLENYTVAQIVELIDIAAQNNAVQCTAVLMDYKNSRFADYDAFDAFSLDW
ncbi:MAG: DUF4132 domain-containing protein [Clostridiales bacterium]|nr:DUF4132 domain-containing protein [Clostridiales bacterium]